MPMSNYLANAVANAALRNTSYTSPSTVYAALYSTAPTPSTSGTELTGNGYARVSTTFTSPTNGASSTTASITIGPATGNAWPAVVAFGICDASSSGNILFYKTIATQNILVGDSFVVDGGNVTIDINS